MNRVLVVMGVSGAGKSTVGTLLAEQLGWDFEEGDQLHSPENVAKMAAGEPLTDADRKPWLAAVGRWITAELKAGRSGVITCSALRRSYRDVLRSPGVTFVYLAAPAEELRRRLAGRVGHFMPPALLDSQLATLEPPAGDEAALQVDATGDPRRSVQWIVEKLGLSGRR